MEIRRIRCETTYFEIDYREREGTVDQRARSREPAPSRLVDAMACLALPMARVLECPDEWADRLRVTNVKLTYQGECLLATVWARKTLQDGRSMLVVAPPLIMCGNPKPGAPVTAHHSRRAVVALERVLRVAVATIHGLQFIAAQQEFGFLSDNPAKPPAGKPKQVAGGRMLARSRYQYQDGPETIAVKTGATIMRLFEQGRVQWDTARKALEMCIDELDDRMAESSTSWTEDMTRGRTCTGNRGVSGETP